MQSLELRCLQGFIVPNEQKKTNKLSGVEAFLGLVVRTEMFNDLVWAKGCPVFCFNIVSVMSVLLAAVS